MEIGAMRNISARPDRQPGKKNRILNPEITVEQKYGPLID
jgi:hypothetical protein